jgi:phosphatidylglycerol---prolipoprotein diacylglyceryl transferase
MFHFGSLTVRYYGVMIMVGFLVGMWRALNLCRRRMATEPPSSPRRIDPDTVFDIGFWGLLIGLAGAHLVFVLLDWPSYAARPLDAFKIWEGGMSLHGGMLFSILFLVWACRKWKKVSILAAGDICAVSWSIAYAIGRIGCLLNGCCYGGACNLPWAVRFPDELHPGLLTPPSHPIQAYATIFNLFFFFWLTRWEKRPRRDGELFYAYIAMYGFYRYVMEFFRAGVTSTYVVPSLHLTDTHIISIVMMVIGIGAILWLRRHRPAYQDAYLTDGTGSSADLTRSAAEPKRESVKGTAEHGA